MGNDDVHDLMDGRKEGSFQTRVAGLPPGDESFSAESELTLFKYRSIFDWILTKVKKVLGHWGVESILQCLLAAHLFVHNPERYSRVWSMSMHIQVKQQTNYILQSVSGQE